MTELRVTPWRRYGHDRIYVNLPDGTNAAWLDRRTGKLTVLIEAHRDAVLDALTPYMRSSAAGARSAAVTVPDAVHDIAANRPGEALRAKIDEVAPGFWRSVVNWLLGRRSEADGWRKGLAGEQAVAAELKRLTGRGWQVLHSIPLARDVDIDHLLIGPGGVFTFNAKHHRGARLWVGDDSVKIGGQTYPYVRKARAEARRASTALTRACGFAVDVQPVLAFVDAAKITVVPSLLDVRAIGHRQIAAFRGLHGVLQPAEVEAIYTAAREARTWSGV